MEPIHRHSHINENTNGFRLALTLGLNLLITATEIIGGIISGSLALISDALHNLSDAASIVITWIGIKLGHKKPDKKRTFGYERTEIFAAIINATTLSAISIWLFVESVRRFMTPVEIKSGIMIITASIGFFANTISTFLLHHDSKNSLNIKATYLHLLGDAVSSFVVILGGIFIYFWNITFIDPILTILISSYIMYQSYSILKTGVNILLQGVPEQINTDEIKQFIIEHEKNVESVHHIHVWSLGDQTILIECHIALRENMHVSQTAEIIANLNKLLLHEFNISHTTFQIEYDFKNNQNQYNCEPGV